MRLLVLSFCVCTALAYHGNKDYGKWRERYLKQQTTTTASPVSNDIYYENLKLRHRSRFPNLDRVMMKIDNMAAQKKAEPVHNKVRHQNLYRTTTTTTTTTDEGLFGDDYGDLDEYEDETESSDDVNEYDDWDGDSLDDYDEDTFDDDDPFNVEEDEDWQAEEATEPPVSAPVSSLTKYKWDNYGTRSKVEESRRQQLNLKPAMESKLRATNAVIDHYMKVKQEGQCRKPLPRVISVQSEHPDPSKTYTPHCTILHRCAEDTGCCSNFETKCGPKVQVQVHLYFYTKTLGVSETKVEKLTFYNHTECACLEKSKQPVTKTPESPLPGLALKMGPSNMRQCKCPAMFSPRYRYDSRCSCDCEEHSQDCLRMKKGKEFFSLTDRMCIMEGRCGAPVCEYGVYLRQIGRCQRKQEKFETYSKLTVQ